MPNNIRFEKKNGSKLVQGKEYNVNDILLIVNGTGFDPDSVTEDSNKILRRIKKKYS